MSETEDTLDRLQEAFDELKTSVREELKALPRWAYKLILFCWPVLQDDEEQ